MDFNNKLLKLISPQLKIYIEENIISLYHKFDKAHNINHVDKVIKTSLELAEILSKNLDIAYTIAACHDIGLGFFPHNKKKSREYHHKYSKILTEQDATLKEFFSMEKIKIIAQACYDHRASLQGTPKSIYGKIIADADRIDGLEIKEMIIRCWNYTISYNPELSLDQRYKEIYSHLKEKYGDNGYAYNSFYLKESKNIVKEEIKNSQRILSCNENFKNLFNQLLTEKKLLK
ncbi:HD domain-containing protein [Orenia marismortui]|uniref:HD/PDEase domain-containing protein n=1 Tax=Orenia marismortui TaxID=46469 RepID=A0A4R8GT68_9FIRM|nr:HD domain-containing protein [Orenia marismortui]TDX49225.1 uncharacterized protein C7959_11946 [Orenia marismortui]